MWGYHKNLYKIVDIVFISVNICTYQQTRGMKTMRLTYDIKITEVTGEFTEEEIINILQGKEENETAYLDFVNNEINIYDEDEEELFESVASFEWVPYFENK